MTRHRPSAAAVSAAFTALFLASALAACAGSSPTDSGPGAITVSSVTPASGPAAGGTAITLEGSGFSAGDAVRLGGVPAAGVQVVSATRITAVSPAHAGGAVDVQVMAADGRSGTGAGAFSFQEAPVLSFLEPGHLPEAGGAVILHGSSFAPGARVLFGAAASQGDPVVTSSSQLSAVAGPQAPGLVDVTVENPDGQRSTLPAALRFDAAPPPPPPPPATLALTGVAPASGPESGGTVVTLDGAGFDPLAAVTFGGAPATVTAHSDTSITVSTPPHAPGEVEVAVVNPGGARAARAAAFTFVPVPAPAPVVAAVEPASGPEAGGATVVVVGAGFQAGAAVDFGGAPAAVLEALPGQLTVLTQAHPAASVAVTVHNPDGQAATLADAYRFVASPALALLGVGPSNGPTAGGTPLTLTGTAFEAGAAVSVGGAAAAVVTVTPTSIVATAPPHAAGVVPVSVRNPGGATATLAAAFSYLAPAAPTPSSVAPTTGPDLGGTLVAISGSGFAEGLTVTFGGVAAPVASRTATTVTVTAPPHPAGAVDLVVANPDGQQGTLAAAFTYLPPPQLGGLSPTSGPEEGGYPVILTGAGFQGGATVTFGGLGAPVVSLGSSDLVVTAPAHAPGPVDVLVTNPDGRQAALASAFTYLAPRPPAAGISLAALSPASGPDAGGTTVTLIGGNFLAGATVAFGGSPAVVGAVTSSTISVTTPAHLAGAVDVVVVNPDGQAATLPAAYTFVAPPPAPVLAGVLPASGTTAGGTAVALTGAGFQPGAVVRLGGVAAAVVSSSATAIAVTTPAHAAGAVDVSVQNPDGQATTLPAAFTFVAPPPPPPVLSGLSPVSGPTTGGTPVTLSGAAFSATVTVAFGGAAAAVTASSATSITATAPPHAAGAVEVVVTNADGQQAALPAAFAYVAPPPPPVVAGLSPASGTTAGATHVVLSGSGFAAGAAVTFGGAAAVVEGVAPTSLTVATPAHAAGVVAVTVTNPDGQATTLPAAFTYLSPPPAPTLASATPAAGATSGGTGVVLAGTGFAAGATVTLGGQPASVGGVTATAIALTTPPHAAGAVDVVVRNPDGQQATLAGGFTYLAPPPPPAITGVTPNTGPLAGGTAVTLDGSGFVAGAAVTFGGVAGAVSAVGATAIAVTTPPGAAGSVDVTVTNPDGQSATFVGAFAYADPPPVGNPPAITAVSPTSGYVTGGTQVTITGKDFRTPDVLFDGAPATLVTSTATSLLVLTPPHASGPVTVTVTNPDGTTVSRANGYRFVPLPVLSPPTLTAVTPPAGPVAGNALVTLTGTNFFAGATVTFGGAAASVQTLTSTEIAVLTPAMPAGTVNVQVANVDGQAATLVAGYAFVSPPPVVTAVGVRGSPQDGGGTQLLVGSGLENTVSVAFGGVAAADLAYDPQFGNLTVTIPPSPLGPTADGFVDIVLVNRDGQTTTWPGFHYGNPPRPLSFTPDTAPRDATVVITGVDFTADATGPRVGLQVSFGGNPAVVTARSATELSVLVPKMNPGQYKIVVVNFDGQVGVAPGVFTAPGP